MENNNNESIFNFSEERKPEIGIPNMSPVNSGENLSDMLNKLSSKLLTGFQNQKEENSLKQFMEKAIKENEAFFSLLTENNCKLKFSERFVEIDCEPLNLVGKIFMYNDAQLKPDLNAQKIFKYLADKSLQKKDIENPLEELEKEGFYPVGELKKMTIKVNGEQTEVMAGMLVNNNKETRTIYFKDGKQVFPDE